jgi:hypothetical protein
MIVAHRRECPGNKHADFEEVHGVRPDVIGIVTDVLTECECVWSLKDLAKTL